MESKLVPVALFMGKLRSLDGCAYIWGAKGPDTFDCSGAITFALLQAGGPDLRQTHNSEALADECEKLVAPHWPVGALAFYGKPHVSHIMAIDLGIPESPFPFSALGACGGDHSTTTLDAAKLRGAKVQHRKQVAYRPDLRYCGLWKRLSYDK